ncbi:1-deoxy-D-xylulose-5-phosphate synthase [Striga asiatica]|uniref:1-deoxy-D-xylulose-5-phosphate synthase n=1 Tax=Striga asiatica TaxID=4170 RepID=A0A5A7RAR8_STRAF|nr:1-deoxy-D-xylulose-5-phosphate synthase [Striga asiatica]
MIYIDDSKFYLLRGTAAEGHACHVKELLFGHEKVFVRNILSETECCGPTRDDRDFKQRLGMPPITRSIADSKCCIVIIGLSVLAAIKAASLHTLAISAPANPGIDTENLIPSLNIGFVDRNLTIKPPGPQQGLVQYIGPVCTCKYNHTRSCPESIHLDEKLIQRAFTLVIPTGKSPTATSSAYGVYFVDEDYARSTLSSLLE